MKKLSLLAGLLFILGCSTTFYREQTAEKVSIPKFMGRWYVIAHIPTFIETDAFNALETYTLKKDGEIAVDFRFNEKNFDGELKVYSQRAWVFDQETKAHWKVRPFWPLKLDYLIHYVSADYGVTMIGVPDHDYLWIMSKRPSIADDERIMMEEIAEELGYDLSLLREIPHNETSVE